MKVELVGETGLRRKTVASSLLHESSASASPRSNTPKPVGKGTWEMSSLQGRAEHRTGGEGPENKSAKDWQGLLARPVQSPEMQNLPAHLVTQTACLKKESKSI